MMKSKKAKILCVILVMSLAVAALPGCGNDSDGETVHHFNVSFANPEALVAPAVRALDRIQERSNGRITMTYYFAWSLSSPPTIIDDINAGMVHIGAIPITEHTTRLPHLSTAAYVPMLGFPNMLEVGPLIDSVIADYPIFAEEFSRNDLVYITQWAMAPYHIWLAGDREIRTPSDFAGMRVVTSCRMLQALISDNGGAPVTMPVTDYAISLSTGVVDGAIMHVNIMRTQGALDFIDSATIFADSGLTTAIQVFAFNDRAWNALSSDLQQLFLDEAEYIRDGIAQLLHSQEQSNMEWFEETGANITTLTPAELDMWRELAHVFIEDELQIRYNDGATQVFEIFESVVRRTTAMR